MIEVSKEELQVILHSFKKDKIPSLEGLLVELFTNYFEFFGDDMVRVVKYA
jgi:hypothetical protein